MIKFFRKIRYDLMDQNKTTKYLKYAIGEIVLVVIGILIALSINNWNEDRIEKIEEFVLLENLKIDFEQTILELLGMNANRQIILSSNYALTDIKTQDDYLNNKKIDSLIGNTFIVPTFNGKSGSLLMLLNSGKINILQNESLKKLLFSWPSEVEDMTEGEIDSKNLTNTQYIPLVRKHANVSEIIQTSTMLSITPKDRGGNFVSDYKGLLNDKEFENLLYQLELYSTDNIQETEGLIEIAKSIVEIIETELNQ
ncbi:hypothetical protein OE09_0887 [Flavobacteriaceae bacterium MAR_2010_72]|nr:hypothetical protein OE09_0887 [Flavobacteriaceae bacterium MAR_2010_72]